MVLPMPPTITATFAPLPLPQALERLSDGTGERWTCTPSLKDEVLFARLTDAPPEKVKCIVGEVLDARWEADGSMLRLVPDAEAARRRAERNEAARRGRIVAGLTRLRAELGKLPPRFTAADAKAYADRLEAWSKKLEKWLKGSPGVQPPLEDDLERATPSWRAAASVVLALPFGSYEALAPGARIVYGDRPTPMQLAFPPAALPALTQCRAEAPPYAEGKSAFRYRLVLTRKESVDLTGEIQAQFEAIDNEGESIESESISIDSRPDEPAPSTSEKPVPLDPEIVAHDALLTDDEGAGAVRDARFEAWSARLQDPVRDEPLKWGVGAAVLAFAEAKGETTLGTVSDDMTTPGPSLENGGLPANYLDLLAPLWRREDGWLVFDPPHQLPRISRAAAGAYIRQAVRAGGLTLDVAGAWVSSLPSGADDWASETIRALTSTPIPGETDDLRLWAALGGDARAALRAGQTISLLLVPSAAQKMVEARLYGSNSFVSEGPEIEPTERFAEGTPDSKLSLGSSESAALIAWNAAVGEPVVRRLASASALGHQVGRSDAQGRTNEPDRFRVTENRGAALTLTYGLNVRLTCLFDEALLPPDGPVLKALPEDLTKDFEAGRARGRAAATKGQKP